MSLSNLILAGPWFEQKLVVDDLQKSLSTSGITLCDSLKWYQVLFNLWPESLTREPLQPKSNPWHCKVDMQEQKCSRMSALTYITENGF